MPFNVHNSVILCSNRRVAHALVAGGGAQFSARLLRADMHTTRPYAELRNLPLHKLTQAELHFVLRLLLRTVSSDGDLSQFTAIVTSQLLPRVRGLLPGSGSAPNTVRDWARRPWVPARVGMHVFRPCYFTMCDEPTVKYAWDGMCRGFDCAVEPYKIVDIGVGKLYLQRCDLKLLNSYKSDSDTWHRQYECVPSEGEGGTQHVNGLELQVAGPTVWEDLVVDWDVLQCPVNGQFTTTREKLVVANQQAAANSRPRMTFVLCRKSTCVRFTDSVMAENCNVWCVCTADEGLSKVYEYAGLSASGWASDESRSIDACSKIRAAWCKQLLLDRCLRGKVKSPLVNQGYRPPMSSLAGVHFRDVITEEEFERFACSIQSVVPEVLNLESFKQLR